MPLPPAPKDSATLKNFEVNDVVYFIRKGKWVEGKILEKAGSSRGRNMWRVQDKNDEDYKGRFPEDEMLKKKKA